MKKKTFNKMYPALGHFRTWLDSVSPGDSKPRDCMDLLISRLPPKIPEAGDRIHREQGDVRGTRSKQ